MPYYCFILFNVHICTGGAREKLEAWLAKHGKTPSRYRHMMCFGAHGIGHAGSHGMSDSHVGSSVPLGHAGSVVKHHSSKQDIPRVSFDDDVVCSLFTVVI